LDYEVGVETQDQVQQSSDILDAPKLEPTLVPTSKSDPVDVPAFMQLSRRQSLASLKREQVIQTVQTSAVTGRSSANNATIDCNLLATCG